MHKHLRFIKGGEIASLIITLERLARSVLFQGRLLLLMSMAFAMIGDSNAQILDGSPLSQSDARRIEVLIRSELGIPAHWAMSPPFRQKPSKMAGFDVLVITFYSPDAPTQKHELGFLLSTDGRTLIQVTSYDLTASPGTNISVAERPVRGEKGAKVEIISFDDLECPYCAIMNAELFPGTLEHYKGLVKVVYKDDPLVEIHPWAMHAAVNANCLATQSGQAYWSYVDYVHLHNREISGVSGKAREDVIPLLDSLALKEGDLRSVDVQLLRSCILRQDDSNVRASMKDARELRVEGTPVLFINGERLSGAQSQLLVWDAIDRAIKSKGMDPPFRLAPGAAPSFSGNSPK